jgi:hypothetical protein
MSRVASSVSAGVRRATVRFTAPAAAGMRELEQRMEQLPSRNSVRYAG